MDHVLVANSWSYEGQYVTTCADSNEVVTSSPSPVEAYREAVDKGCQEPVLVYVPTKEEDEAY